MPRGSAAWQRSDFRAFLHYFARYRKLAFFLMLGAAAGAALELVFPLGVRQILHTELPKAAWPPVLRWCIGLGLVYLLNFLVLFGVSYGGGLLSAQLENDLRQELFRHLQTLPFAFFDNAKTGQLLATLTGDVAETGELAARLPGDLLVSVVSLLGTACILLYLDPLLGGLVTLLMGLKALHTIWINLKLKATFGQVRQEYGHLSAIGEENLSGVRMVRASTAESWSVRAFARASRAYLAARRRSFGIRSYFGASVNFFTNSIYLAILLAGSWQIQRGALLLSDLVAFFLYVGVFIKPVMKLVLFVETYQQSMAGFRRFRALMGEAAEDQEPLPELPPVQGKIEFQDVSFGYHPGNPVLQHISLVIQPGEKVAFVGPTGTGKSTLISLLLRFYEPQSGSILVDGRDISQYSRRSLRRQIALVQQDVFLFFDSVWHNLVYGTFECSEEEVCRAAEAARALDFIRQLPEQFATEIGERGIKLSGGQRQRLALARAFLKNGAIVVLDEATSALDNITEAQIQGELQRLSRGKTTLMIAHRLSTVAQADTIVVLDRGRIVEKGSPAELLARKGAYYRLWQKETGKLEEKERRRQK